MSDQTNSKLLVMLRSSDRTLRNQALTTLYQDNFPAIRALILKNSGNLEDAEDIFQDGLIALYEQVNNQTFKETSSIKTYLYAICRNLWMKRLRKSSTKNEILGQEVDFAETDILPLDLMIADEESETLADLLGQIGADCQRVLLLYYYERKRMQEIAKVMGFANEQVAKNKKNRCLKKLKELAKKIPHFKPFFL